MSTLTYAILARVAETPTTGYDLAKLRGVAFRHFWAATHSQIYPELARLEAAGLVEAREESGPGPRAKKIYSITEAGKEALREWAVGPLKRAEGRDEFAVRMSATRLIGPEETARLLREERAAHAAQLAEYEAIEAAFERVPTPTEDGFGGYATLQLGLSYERHRLAWCDWYLDRLAGQG